MRACLEVAYWGRRWNSNHCIGVGQQQNGPLIISFGDGILMRCLAETTMQPSAFDVMQRIKLLGVWEMMEKSSSLNLCWCCFPWRSETAYGLSLAKPTIMPKCPRSLAALRKRKKSSACARWRRLSLVSWKAKMWIFSSRSCCASVAALGHWGCTQIGHVTHIKKEHCKSPHVSGYCNHHRFELAQSLGEQFCEHICSGRGPWPLKPKLMLVPMLLVIK